jgi:hypothetical protein
VLKQPLAPAHVVLFLSIVQTSPVDEARLHCVGLLGNIALLPALQPCLGDIGQVLLATLPRDNSGWLDCPCKFYYFYYYF